MSQDCSTQQSMMVRARTVECVLRGKTDKQPGREDQEEVDHGRTEASGGLRRCRQIPGDTVEKRPQSEAESSLLLQASPSSLLSTRQAELQRREQ